MPSSWDDALCDFRDDDERTCSINSKPEGITLRDCATCARRVHTPGWTHLQQRPQVWHKWPIGKEARAWLDSLGVGKRGSA